MEDIKKLIVKCRKLSIYWVAEWFIFVLMFSVELGLGASSVMTYVYFVIMWILFIGSGYLSYDFLKKTFIPKEVIERDGNLIKIVKGMILCNLAITVAILGGGLGMSNSSETAVRLSMFLPLIIMFTGIKLVFIFHSFKLGKVKFEDGVEEQEPIPVELVEPISAIENKTEEITAE